MSTTLHTDECGVRSFVLCNAWSQIGHSESYTTSYTDECGEIQWSAFNKIKHKLTWNLVFSDTCSRLVGHITIWRIQRCIQI